MAKKITRGITGIKDINKQDFDTNNVNDLLSDGQYNYIHRKKGKSEEYHNLTDNIKTISSDNTDLLAVTNNNKTTNSATLHPKHDAQKEQVLESERATITINHGTNGTPEKTKVDTNPEKVLEHENLISDSEYITLSHETGENSTHIQTTALKEELEQLHQTLSVESYVEQGEEGGCMVYKQTITNGGVTLRTYAFTITGVEIVLSGELKQDLEKFVGAGVTVSSGTVSITNDGTNIKLNNSMGIGQEYQQATFTFGGKGGGGVIRIPSES